ncbi:hypothetical protein [Novosphingobium sp. BW1]|uniref:hypothetical protein n=1 Tax=Novosphingobium sp. BW1 TaxID=2592621 RepID=UPI0011DE5A8D|nr:hypothetical protein [Novosphingobium sp. BW1]TYC93065.1 hypothetical protein FMM79_03505 [Novosphingobium sp. BW1]
MAEFRHFGEPSLDGLRGGENREWLGRQDSNLRMAVPKTVLGWPPEPGSLRKVPIFHKHESITYQEIAERNRRSAVAIFDAACASFAWLTVAYMRLWGGRA